MEVAVCLPIFFRFATNLLRFGKGFFRILKNHMGRVVRKLKSKSHTGLLNI